MAGNLTVRKIETAKLGKYGDGNGLWLIVRTQGRRWIFRYTFNKKRREMGLGSYPVVTLLEARERVMEYRRMITQGIDPIEKRRKIQKKAKILTFSQVAALYIYSHRKGWKNYKHRMQWVSTLKTYACPVIGKRPIDQIETDDILNIINPIWTQKTETAKRVQGRLENILDFAAAREWRNPLNPARWRGHLDKILPAPSKIKKVRPQPAMPWQELPAFMIELNRKENISALALKFLILTATRTKETREAMWSEVSFKDAIWIIPAERMKGGKREHRVPLTTPMLEILGNIPHLTNSPFIFYGQVSGKSLSDMALLKQMRSMGYGVNCERGNYVPHGFRSSFRDWVGETTAFPSDVAEMALAHAIRNKTEAAYRRGDLFDKRRKLMEAWGDFCLQQNQSTIVPIGINGDQGTSQLKK